MPSESITGPVSPWILQRWTAGLLGPCRSGQATIGPDRLWTTYPAGCGRQVPRPGVPCHRSCALTLLSYLRLMRGMDENVGAALDLLLSRVRDALDVVVAAERSRRGWMPGNCRRCTRWIVSSGVSG